MQGSLVRSFWSWGPSISSAGYRIEDRLMIDEILQQGNNEPTGNNAGSIVNQVTTGIMSHQALLVKLDRMERQINDQFKQVFSMIEASNTLARTHYQSMNTNIRRFGGTIEGALAVQRGNGRDRQQAAPFGNGAAGHQDALLSNNPRTLIELWRECKHGLDGRKPAEQFTMVERHSRVGGVKQKWYRRNVVAVHGKTCAKWRYSPSGRQQDPSSVWI